MKFNLIYEKIIRDYSFENTNTKAIFVFGRMNPPTAGHEMLINHAKNVADTEHRQLFVFLSHKQDNKSDPLTHEEKLAILDPVFDDVIFVNDSTANTPFNAAYWLRDHGFKNVKMVVGSDRAPEFKARFKPYLRHKDPSLSFNFKKFKLETVGAIRDPDSDDMSGISASKARLLAQRGNMEGFAQILPADASQDVVEKAYNQIRNVLGVEDEQSTSSPEQSHKTPA
jgi:hypothetical protein